MSKQLKHEMRYDGSTPEQVYAMLSDPAFREAVCEYQRYPRRDIQITPNGNGMHVRVDQHRPATEVPAFARKLVGEEINILQAEVWSSPTQASLHVGIPGKPGQMAGTVSLAGDDAGTTETVEVTVTASIPLIGGKIEGFISDMLLRALKAENRVGQKWLAENR